MTRPTTRHHVRTALLLLGLAVSSTAFAAGPVPTPKYGIFATADEIARGRQRCETDPGAREYRDKSIQNADAWLARSDESIRALIPPAGSTFSYGVAGCPSCGKDWGRFGAKVASLDKPLHLHCPHCDTDFDLTTSDGPFADDGPGVVVNGRRFFVRGTWNGFVADRLWSAFSPGDCAIVNLADAYALTGDDRYARKLIVVMDALATLAPTTIGPRDFTTNPKEDTGRLQHLTSIVFRAQVHFARALDLVGRHPDLEKPSPTNPTRGSILANVRHGIFEEYLFVPIDTRGGKLHTLHNHEADSVRALIVSGLMFANPDHLRWGATGLRAFLDNTIDRDGLYYETSLSYTEFTKSVFVDMADMLVRYDPSLYPPGMPKRDEIPFHGNYFDHPALARLVLDSPSRVSIVGRMPTYGNGHYDTQHWRRDGRSFSRPEFQQALRFMMYATEPAIRTKAATLATAMLPAAGGKPYGGQWAVYREPTEPEILAAAAGATTRPATAVIPETLAPDFFGQTGLTILRSGAGRSRRGAIFRAGQNMPHAHDDQLGLLLYANGRALSGDVGYGIFGNHVHLGWAGRAIAHNTVVVNQDESGLNQLFRIGPGGTIDRFYAGPGVSLAEASLTPMFGKSDNVRDFRRTVLQIDISPEASYWLDLFDVDGGRVHDYSFHANPVGKDGTFTLDGVDPKEVEGVYTLAGLDPKWVDASFDHSGRSWGQRLTNNGMIAKVDGADDVPAKYPPPGNGYGFLHDVRRATTARPWSATWTWPDARDPHGLRLTMLPAGDQQVITALGPTITGAQQMNFVIARHGQPGATASDLRSRYTAVMEPFGKRPLIRSIRRGDTDNSVVIAGPAGEDTITDRRNDGGGITIARRSDGSLASLTLIAGASATADGVTLRFDAPVITATVTAADETTFTVTPPLPPSAIGSTVTITNPAYSHGSAYRVASATADGVIRPMNASLVLGRAAVDKSDGDTLTSTAPLVFGFEYGKSTRFLDGKRIQSAGATGHVTGMTDFGVIQTKGLSPKPGDAFVVTDVQPGDSVTMDCTAALVRAADDTYTLTANAPVTMTFPSPVERKRGDSWTPAEGATVTITASDLAAGPVTFRAAK